MFSFFTPYKWVIGIVGTLVFIGGIFYGVHKFAANQQNIGYQKAVAEYTVKQLAAEQAARKKESEWNNKIEEARNEAAIMEQKNNELNITLNDTNKRMRNTVANLRNQLSRATEATARRQADAALDVSGDCSEKYTELAKDAARLSAQVIFLQSTWPK